MKCDVISLMVQKTLAPSPLDETRKSRALGREDTRREEERDSVITY